MKKSSNNIDTGAMLEEFLVNSRMYKSTLAAKIGRPSQSVNKYVQNSSIQTGILLDICHAFKHNFFQDIASQLPADFSVSQKRTQQLHTQIEQLQEEIKVLKIQNELLLQIRS